MKINRKKIMLLSISSAVAAVPVLTSVGISVSSSKINSYDYLYNNQHFTSNQQMLNYINSNAKEIKVESNDTKWQLMINGQTKYYNSPEELRNDVIKSNKFKEITVKTDTDLSKFVDPKTGIFNNNDFFKNISDPSSQETTIYQGNDDNVYDNELKAYESYFTVKKGYYFNGIYFDNKQTLNTYLNSIYFANKEQNYNTIILKSPNGNSYPIDLSRPDAFDSLNNFIKANAETVLSYEKDNKSYIINKSNLDEMINKVNLADLNYNHIQSNQGQSRYIIDNMDSSNLIGPYFYNGVLDIGSFMNKNMWRKVTGVPKLEYLESKVDLLIGTFFSSILNDDNNLNKMQAENGQTNPLLFRTLLTASDNKTSYDQWFLDQLKLLSVQLYDEVINANNSMMSGNKYNTFFKIPVLYSFLMQRAISYNLSQKVINLINEYFINVCNYIQDILEFAVLNNTELLSNKDNTKIFDMKEFFEIGTPEYDLNTSTEYFLNKLKTEYPNVVLLASNYMAAENNITMTSGMIPQNSQDFSMLIESGIFSNMEQLSVQNTKFENTYNMFSALNYDSMLAIYIKNNANPSIRSIASQPENIWKDEIKKVFTKNSNIPMDIIISGIGAKNNQYTELANSVLKLEINTYFETKVLVYGGYLEKLYDQNAKLDRLGTFLNLVGKNKNNPNFNVYQTYLAFLLEKKQNTYYFTPEVATDYSLFAQRLSYLIGMSFGSGLLVGSSLKKLYNGPDKLEAPVNAPILTLYKETENRPVPPTPSEDWTDDWDDDTTTSGDNSNRPLPPIPGEGDGDNGSDVGNRPLPPIPGEGDGDLSNRPLPPIPGEGDGDLSNRPLPPIPGEGDNTNTPSRPSTPTSHKTTEMDIYAVVNKKKGRPVVPQNLDTELLNPEIRSIEGLDENRRISMVDLDEFLRSNSFDTDKESIYEGIDKYLQSNVERQSNHSKVNNPIDEAAWSVASDFDYKDSYDSEWDDFTEDNSNQNRPNNSTRPNTPESFETQKKAWFSGSKTKFNTMFNAFKEGAEKVLNFAVEIFGGVFAALEIGFFIFDLLRVENIKEFYQYVTPDGTSFYWDGGLTVTKYFGLQVNTIHNIDEMQLITPVQITLPQTEECYYYDGVKYFDINELKKAILKSYLNNETTSSKFSRYFTILNEVEPYKSQSVDELINNVIKDLNIVKNTDGSFDFTNLNKSSIYLQTVSNSFNGGYISNNSDNHIGLINNIINNIRSTYFAILPDTNNGIANGSVTTKFTYPGKYFNGNVVVDNPINQNILVDNSANMLSSYSFGNNFITQNDFVNPDYKVAEQESINNLFTKFRNSFKVQNKNILPISFVTNKFSDISSNISIQKIYQVTNPNGKIVYYYNINSAAKAFGDLYNFEKISTMENKWLFEYKIFDSQNEIINYIKTNGVRIS